MSRYANSYKRGREMYEFKNLPTKNGPKIEGKPQKECFRVQTEEGWMICEVGRATDQQTAYDIACAIRFARDTGYAQALAHIRHELGIRE
jgi:hypothetical protein